MVLEKTLESPLDCKEIQPSILKEISPGISLEGMMLKLKLQYFGGARVDVFISRCNGHIYAVRVSHSSGQSP